MSSRKSRLIRRLLVVLGLVIVVYGGVIGFSRYMGAKFLDAMADMPRPPVSVSVAKAGIMIWPQTLSAVASLKSIQGASLSPQSAGTVTGLFFDSGDLVKKGQLLLQLNDNVARAQLASAQARLINARLVRDRQQDLIKRHAISQASLDQAVADFREAKAAVQQAQAVLTDLQLRAPFDGHLGIREVALGQYVAPGTIVTSIEQWNPLRLIFSLPQHDIMRIKIGDPVHLLVQGLNKKGFDGKVNAIDASVDARTRDIQIEARIDNPNERLRSGMYGVVQVILKQDQQTLAVPQTAITFKSYGAYLYVIEHKQDADVAIARSVQTGRHHQGYVAITQGLKAGERVVIAGQVKLHNGARVQIVPAPKALLHPSMENKQGLNP
ncbi:Probable Co/Zn/Cd efflux system membrane fusion protein [hydrothermal vent metagenome]|uniref:Probable Co/Zn/Cd efflux system membrane fusion protein n=1 Tax=hydrothermal vent metagenome TaxID=652676 RepID=A0A3B1BS80_9ZZZZ